MLRVIVFALALLTAGSASAQSPWSFGDPAAPKPAQPIPLTLKDWRMTLAPPLCPNGTYQATLNTCSDGHDGYVWQYNPNTGKLSLRPPKILYGTGAVVATNLYGAPAQNKWNALYGAVGANGFRGGLTAYIGNGNYWGSADVTVATNSASQTYTVRVLMGSCLQPAGASQAGILTIPMAVTNATTAAGNATLHFSGSGTGSTACISAGMVAYDTTASTVISAANAVVTSVTSTTVVITGTGANGAGVGNGDTIEFGFPIGYGISPPCPGPGFACPIHVTWSTGNGLFPCLAAEDKYGLHQQCEIFAELFTPEAGTAVLASAGQMSPPPYATSFFIGRLDGNYGAGP